jgi:oxygen-independent coproporphyrinogen-3 oxidase
MLLYIHVPFCRRKCRYCAFVSWQAKSLELEAYYDHLLLELETWSQELFRPEIESVFIGGGTPSCLSLAHLERLFAVLNSGFRLVPGLEVTIEANPESLWPRPELVRLHELGVTRLSLGGQSFSDRALAWLGRRHTAKDISRAIDRAAEAGFANINLDLLYGLPGQSVRSWLDELARAASQTISHLSCYGLTPEPGTPLAADVRSGQAALPAGDEQADMFVFGAEFLENQGFLQYEISNFARNGSICSHNWDIWQGRDYLGCGPAAVSTVKGRRWTNPFTLHDYLRAVRSSELGQDCEVLNHGHKVRELVMLSLRTRQGLSCREYFQLTGRDFCAEHAGILKPLREQGLIRVLPDRVALSRQGMAVCDEVLERLV